MARRKDFTNRRAYFFLILILLSGIFIRIFFFSGYGYSADDINYFHSIHNRYVGTYTITGGYDYRFITWITTVFFFQINWH